MAWYDDVISKFTSKAGGDEAAAALDDYRTLRPVMNRLIRIGLEAGDILRSPGSDAMPSDLWSMTRDVMRAGNEMLVRRQQIDEWILDALRSGIQDGRVDVEDAEAIRDDVFEITDDQRRGLGFAWVPLIVVALILSGGVALAVWIGSHADARARVQVEATRMTAWQNAYQDWLAAGSPGESPDLPMVVDSSSGGGFLDSFEGALGTASGAVSGIVVIVAVGLGAWLLLSRR